MAKASPAKRVRKMIEGLEQLKGDYPGVSHWALRDDIQRAITALERLWKSLVG